MESTGFPFIALCLSVRGHSEQRHNRFSVCASLRYVHDVMRDVCVNTYTITLLWSTCKNKASAQAQETKEDLEDQRRTCIAISTMNKLPDPEETGCLLCGTHSHSCVQQSLSFWSTSSKKVAHILFSFTSAASLLV